MSNLPSDREIEAAANYEINSNFMNKTLYAMCREYLHHDNEDVIKSKLQLIGRAYSASLERRRNKNKDDEPKDIYKLVAEELKNSNIDVQIRLLGEKDVDIIFENDVETISQVLKLHKDFVSVLYTHVEMNKRSLASKYLHFHLPNLIFLYDSIAVESLRKIYPRSKIAGFTCECDTEYSKFFATMLTLREEIHKKYDFWLSPRQLDKLLLRY